MIVGANGKDEAGCSCGDNEIGGGDGDVVTDGLGRRGGERAGGLGVSSLELNSSSSSSCSSSCFVGVVGLKSSMIISPSVLEPS